MGEGSGALRARGWFIEGKGLGHLGLMDWEARCLSQVRKGRDASGVRVYWGLEWGRRAGHGSVYFCVSVAM